MIIMTDFNVVVSKNTEQAPINALHSQTVAFSHYNNLSGQLPIDPTTVTVVAGGIKAQVEQTFNNIKAVVESINHVMDDIVKVTVFLQNIADLNTVDEVYATYFPNGFPARTTVEVSALPMDALVQIDTLVTHGEGTIPDAPQAGDLVQVKRNTESAPTSPLSTQTVAFSHYNNLSAQLPIDPSTGELISADIKEQAAQVLKNIKAILESIDVPFDDIVQLNIYIKDLSDLEAVKEVYSTFFPDSAIARAVAYVPACTVVEVAALPMGALIQVDAVVSHGDGTPPQEVEDRHGIVIEANNTDQAPKSSLSTQSVAFSHYNHLSAQLPIDASTGELVDGGVKAQTELCLNHIKAIVESVDHVMSDVVKVNLFVKNLADLDAINEVYATFFPGGAPARTVVGTAKLPKDALIQISAVVGNAEGTPPEAR